MTELRILSCKRNGANNLEVITDGPELWIAEEDF